MPDQDDKSPTGRGRQPRLVPRGSIGKGGFAAARAGGEDNSDIGRDTEALAAREELAGSAVIISHDRMLLDRLATHMLSFEGDSHVEWFEGNFQDYEADKVRRLGPDSINPHRVSYKKLTR